MPIGVLSSYQEKHAVTPLSQLRQCLSTSLQPQCNNAAVPLQP